MAIFRYPGGKSRLLGHLAPWQDALADAGAVYAEPFAGGGSTLLAFAARHSGHRLVVNDADPWMAAFWRCVAQNGPPGKLLRLLSTKPSVALFRELRAAPPADDEEAAYRAVFFNRTTFSGILTSGPIGGYDSQNTTKWKIDCRYNAERLIDEIVSLRSLVSGRMEAHEEDALSFLAKNSWPAYLDPPYFHKGDMLYPAKFSAHKEMADWLGHRGAWVLSYDDCSEVRAMYSWAGEPDIPTMRYSIQDKKEEWRKTTEVIYASDDIKPRRLFESRAEYGIPGQQGGA